MPSVKSFKSTIYFCKWHTPILIFHFSFNPINATCFLHTSNRLHQDIDARHHLRHYYVKCSNHRLLSSLFSYQPWPRKCANVNNFYHYFHLSNFIARCTVTPKQGMGTKILLPPYSQEHFIVSTSVMKSEWHENYSKISWKVNPYCWLSRAPIISIGVCLELNSA